MNIPSFEKRTKLKKVGSKTEESKPHPRKKLKRLCFIPIVLLLLILYLILNFWAIGQIEVDTSLDGIINSISEFNYKTNLTSTEVRTELIVKNPTIVPVLVTQISYDLTYGNRTLGEGKTGFIFIMPYSKISTPVEFELSHIQTGLGIIEGIINIFQKETKSVKMNFYACYGPIKIPLGALE